MNEQLPNPQELHREEGDSAEMELKVSHEPVLRFATRLKLPESTRKRKRKEPEPVPPRLKSEKELREDEAWKQVEETGKPVVLDQTLLLPDGMSISQAIQFLPDDVRAETEAGWNAKLRELWGMIFKSTEQQIRKDVEEKGELERYSSLPPYARNALTESVVREQWKLPQVPLEELLQQWEKPPKAEGPELPAKKKKRPAKQLLKSSPTVEPIKTKSESPSSGTQPAKVRTGPAEQTPSYIGPSSPSAVEWNQQHHRFLLKRIAQIWVYLDTEEQQAVQEILNRPISKQDIDQIDEIVKGVEWVRRLQR